MNETVLVTEPEFRKAEAVFLAPHGFSLEPAPAAEVELAEAVRRRAARAVIVGVERYGRVLCEALAATSDEQGAIIARFGVGHDGIDKIQARRRGVVVTNTPGVLDISVAEHAMWLMGNLARHVCQLDSRFRAGLFVPCTGMELHGKVLGIVGFGAIGRRVAAIAHRGFGMKIMAVDCFSPAEFEKCERRMMPEICESHGLSLYSNDLEDVLSRVDVVSIHLPSNAQTQHTFNANRLGRMKAGSLLVNTSRGPIIDECALYRALKSGTPAGAALDVFTAEPYQPAAPEMDLRTLDSVVLTPHIGSNTHEANQRMADACLKNITSFFGGQFAALSRVNHS